MNEIRIVDGSYAAVRDGIVIAVVTRIDETLWGFYPVNGCGSSMRHVPLDFALDLAAKHPNQ